MPSSLAVLAAAAGASCTGLRGSGRAARPRCAGNACPRPTGDGPHGRYRARSSGEKRLRLCPRPLYWYPLMHADLLRPAWRSSGPPSRRGTASTYRSPGSASRWRLSAIPFLIGEAGRRRSGCLRRGRRKPCHSHAGRRSAACRVQGPFSRFVAPV